MTTDFLYLGGTLLFVFIVIAISLRTIGKVSPHQESPREKWMKIVFIDFAGFLMAVSVLGGIMLQIIGFDGSYLLGQSYPNYDWHGYLEFFYIISAVPLILKAALFIAGIGVIMYGVRLQRAENGKNWPKMDLFQF